MNLSEVFPERREWLAGGEKWSESISRVLSWTTIPLGRPLRAGSSNLPAHAAGHSLVRLFGLAPDGVSPATPVTGSAVRSYRTFSPLPAFTRVGGMFSVALSVGSRLPAVSRRPALWSPDFPPRIAPRRSSDSLHRALYALCGAVQLGTPRQTGTILTIQRDLRRDCHDR